MLLQALLLLPDISLMYWEEVINNSPARWAGNVMAVTIVVEGLADCNMELERGVCPQPSFAHMSLDVEFLNSSGGK
jgi:hypothetical protein